MAQNASHSPQHRLLIRRLSTGYRGCFDKLSRSFRPIIPKLLTGYQREIDSLSKVFWQVINVLLTPLHNTINRISEAYEQLIESISTACSAFIYHLSKLYLQVIKRLSTEGNKGNKAFFPLIIKAIKGFTREIFRHYQRRVRVLYMKIGRWNNWYLEIQETEGARN